MSNERTYDHKLLKQYCTKVLEKLELSKEDAELIADSLVQANLRGVDSHGVVRMTIYTERLKRGLVKPKGNFSIIKESASTVLLDADNTMGQLASTKAMEIALEKAKETGVCFVGVRNSNHFGTASYFSMMALKAGMIGLAFSNAPATMAPWGARERYYGTNPFAIAVPTNKQLPVVLDMATSVTARGKIILANEKGEKIPSGLAINTNGEITTDAKEALEGAVLPFGGPKGSGIAFLVEVFSGMLTGAAFGPHIADLYTNMSDTQNVGHMIGVINPEKFIGMKEFGSRMDTIISEIKELPKAKGVEEVLLPGELEFRKEQERISNGVPLPLEVIEQLKLLGEKYDVPWIESETNLA